MTEDEAKNKWCPLSRFLAIGQGTHDVASGMVVSGAPAGYNRTSAGQAVGPCIASACMMWRLAKKPNPDWNPHCNFLGSNRDTRFDPPMYVDDPENGYCGLAR